MWRAGLVLAVVGVALGAAAFGVGELRGDEETRAPRGRADRATQRAEPRRVAERRAWTLVIRRRGGVPRAWTARLSGVPGVIAVSRAGRAQVLLSRTLDRRGRSVAAAPSGYAFPLDALVVSSRSYARVLPRAARPAMRRLSPGTALLSRTSARLRGVGGGARLRLADGRTLRVTGVLDDELARGAEIVLDRGDVRMRAAQLTVRTTQPRRLAAALPARRAVRIRALGAARPARGGIARPAELKARFGEFAVRLPLGDDWIGVEPGWMRRNIITRSIPILGTVTCNRRLFPALRRALSELERRGLSRLVDRGDFAGCYAPRRIPGSGSLSLHAWGLAIDLNASRNPQYGASRHDPRLVRAMERAGFTWGGRWPTAPDPMHFELQAPARR